MASLGTAYIKIAPDMSGIQGSISRGMSKAGTDGAKQYSSGFSKSGAVIAGAIGGVVAAATSKVARMVTESIGAAVKRVDTLNNSARTFENMGIDAGAAQKAIKALNTSITGLPTPLDSAVRGMTALTATYGSVDKGQKIFSALNNAILGFGGSADMVDNAITQISQLPMDGPLDAQTWNSLRNSGLTPVLVAMSKEFGMSVSEMKEALGDGELTVEDFMNKLMEMNVKGGGGLKSLEQIAKDSTKGIGTGFANMQTAVTRGMAKVIEAIGSERIAGAIAKVGSVLETMLSAVATGIAALPGIIDGFITTIQTMVQFVKDNAVAFGLLGVAVAALAAPFAIAAAQAMILDLRIRAMLLWSSIGKIITGIATAFRALNAAMLANPIGLVVAAVALLAAGFMLLWNNVEGFRQFFIDLWNNIQIGGQAVADWFTDTFIPAITGAWTSIVETVAGIFESIALWIQEHQTALINWGIVITTLLLPKIMQIGITFVTAAAQAVMAFTTMAAQAAVQFGAAALSATVNAAKTTAAWVASSAQSLAAWLKALPSMIAGFVSAAAAAVKNALAAGAAWVAQAIRTAAQWAVTFAAYLAGVALAAARTLIAGAQMAAAWLLALGPIGIIIAAVIGAAALIIANWEAVKTFFRDAWNAIKQTGVDAWNGIKDKWQEIKTWFTNIDLTGSGKALIDGLIGGITSGFNKAKDFVKGKLADLRGLFPFSPAKEGPFSGMGYTTHSGKALMEDFAKGIGDNANKARQAAMGAMSGIQGAMNADYNIGVNDAGAFAPAGADKSPAIINLHVGSRQIASQIIDDINDISFLTGRNALNL